MFRAFGRDGCSPLVVGVVSNRVLVAGVVAELALLIDRMRSLMVI